MVGFILGMLFTSDDLNDFGCRAPALGGISVTPASNLGNAAKFWISDATNTQFATNVDVDPGATTATLSWSLRM